MIGCTSSDTIVVNSFVGLEDITENLITISPNPVNDIAQIQGIVGPFQVDLFDLFGKHLLSTNKPTVNLSDYSNGIYLFRLTKGNQVVTLRVFKD